jgi:hypothetical protein
MECYGQALPKVKEAAQMRYQSLRNRPVLQEVRELVSSRVMTLEVVKEVGEVPLIEEEVEIEAAEVLEEVHLTVDNDQMTGNRSR